MNVQPLTCGPGCYGREVIAVSLKVVQEWSSWIIRDGIYLSNSFSTGSHWVSKCTPKGPWIRQLSSWWWVATGNGADRNMSVLSGGFWGRGSLMGFHRIRYTRVSHLGRIGFVIPIEWKYMTRPTVKIIYAPNIWSSFYYKFIRR